MINQYIVGPHRRKEFPADWRDQLARIEGVTILTPESDGWFTTIGTTLGGIYKVRELFPTFYVEERVYRFPLNG